jgi:Bacteriophage lambda head decoration protein D
MPTTAYQRIPVPGFTSPTATATDPEILYSTAAFTQKGVTLAGGQGVLAAGTLLGQKTADKKYYAYSNAASDGTQTARGVLRRPVDTGASGSGAADQLSNIVIQGILKLSMIVGSDSAAITDLGAVVDTVRGTFKF